MANRVTRLKRQEVILPVPIGKVLKHADLICKIGEGISCILRAPAKQIVRTCSSALAANILAVLKPVWYDQQLLTSVKRLKKKVAVFDQLRTVMSIAEPAGKLGLNDPKRGAIHTIEARVQSFYRKLVNNDTLQEVGFQKMQQQLEKYWGNTGKSCLLILSLLPEEGNRLPLLHKELITFWNSFFVT
jgi:hypothetical protein